MRIIILASIINFFLAGYTLFIPFTDKYIADGSYSALCTLEAVGGILGATYYFKFPKESQNDLVKLIFLSSVSLFLAFLVMKIKSILFFYVFILIFDILISLFNLSFINFLQKNVHQEYLGRVFSIIATVTVLFIPAGTFVFSFLVDLGVFNFCIIAIGISLTSLIYILFNSIFLNN